MSQPKSTNYTFEFHGAVNTHADTQELDILSVEYVTPSPDAEQFLLGDKDYFATFSEDTYQHGIRFAALIRAADYRQALNILRQHAGMTIVIQSGPLYNLKHPYEDPNERIS